MLIYQWLNIQKKRFYKITINSNNNNFLLNYYWGSYVSNRGGRKDILLDSEDEVNKTISDMMKRRKSRGYELTIPAHQ
jgi:hypothetical protein